MAPRARIKLWGLEVIEAEVSTPWIPLRPELLGARPVNCLLQKEGPLGWLFPSSPPPAGKVSVWFSKAGNGTFAGLPQPCSCPSLGQAGDWGEANLHWAGLETTASEKAILTNVSTSKPLDLVAAFGARPPSQPYPGVISVTLHGSRTLWWTSLWGFSSTAQRLLRLSPSKCVAARVVLKRQLSKYFATLLFRHK